MGKLIFILVDALGFDVATKHFGFLEHMAETGQAAKYRLYGELPSLSRPMYETLLTGLPVWQHGITANEVCRKSRVENIFSMTRKASLTNACAGYSWLLELYGDRSLPFDLYDHHETVRHEEAFVPHTITDSSFFHLNIRTEKGKGHKIEKIMTLSRVFLFIQFQTDFRNR